MPIGRKRALKRFEHRAEQFTRLTKLGRVARSEAHKGLLVGTGVTRKLIKKEKRNDFRRTVSAQTRMQKLAEKEPPNHFTLVFPAHSAKGMVQERFHAPTIFQLQAYLAGFKQDRKTTLLCKELLHRKGNEKITQVALAIAVQELAAFTWHARVDMGDNLQENGVILGMDPKNNRIRLAVIDA